jgi:hypothetical protein
MLPLNESWYLECDALKQIHAAGCACGDAFTSFPQNALWHTVHKPVRG